MTPSEIIRRLYSLGHFHNPAHPSGVEESELNQLHLHDSVVRAAIASYQEYMSVDFDRLSIAEHKRLGIADGEVGPATKALLEEPRCGFPDYPYPEGIMAAKMEANWPETCRRNLKFSRNFQSLPNLSEEDTDKIYHGMSNNWTYALSDVDITSLAVGERTDAHIYAGLKALGGSTLAWSYLAQDRCDVQLEQAYNTQTRWSMALAVTVATHEVGHAIGLPHNRDSTALMYPSINQSSQARLGYPGPTDLAQAKSLGYILSGSEPPKPGDLYRPRPHTPIPPVPPTDPTDPYWFSGDFELMQGEIARGKFILIPKPKV